MLIAVDVALLPEPRALSTFVDWNARLLAAGDTPVRLSVAEQPGCGLPHLSLCMGVVGERNTAALADAVARGTRRIDAEVRGLQQTRHGELPVTSLGLVAGDDLRVLHEMVMGAARPFLESARPTSSMFAEAERDPPAEASKEWVALYASAAAGEGFDPHVTLGHGTVAALEGVDLPARVRFDALGIFHLGASCTCRRALWRSGA